MNMFSALHIDLAVYKVGMSYILLVNIFSYKRVLYSEDIHDVLLCE